MSIDFPERESSTGLVENNAELYRAGNYELPLDVVVEHALHLEIAGIAHMAHEAG